MPPIKRQLLICLAVYALLLVHLGGCAIRMPLDVGQVVVAPQVKLPAPPVVVQQTLPKPVGFYQNSLLNFFSDKQQTPTPLTTPTPAAAQTPSQ